VFVRAELQVFIGERIEPVALFRHIGPFEASAGSAADIEDHFVRPISVGQVEMRRIKSLVVAISERSFFFEPPFPIVEFRFALVDRLGLGKKDLE